MLRQIAAIDAGGNLDDENLNHTFDSRAREFLMAVFPRPSIQTQSCREAISTPPDTLGNYAPRHVTSSHVNA